MNMDSLNLMSPSIAAKCYIQATYIYKETTTEL